MWTRWKLRPGDVSLLLQLLLDLTANLFSNGVHLPDLGEEGSNLIAAEEACSSPLQHVSQASLNSTWEWKRRKDELARRKGRKAKIQRYMDWGAVGAFAISMYISRKGFFLQNTSLFPSRHGVTPGGFSDSCPRQREMIQSTKDNYYLQLTGWCWSYGKYFSRGNRTNNM